MVHWRFLARGFLGSVLAGTVISTGVVQAGTLSFDTKADWEQWNFPEGTLELSVDGLVTPKYIRKNINACLNAGDFAIELADGKPVKWGGISAAGTNQNTAANVIDGDPDTWWAPDPGEDMKKWWVEIHLGRLVSATKIVLKFPPGGKPFRMFKVYTSSGEEALYSGSGRRAYDLAGQTTRPNYAYELEYPLGLLRSYQSTAEQPRELVTYVLFQVTAPFEEDAGLAEIEVHTLGDNVVLGTIERGGQAFQASPGGDRRILLNTEVLDGDFSTYWNSSAGFLDWTEKGWVHIQLGALFWIDTIRVLSAKSHQGSKVEPLFGYKLFVTDGTVGPSVHMGSRGDIMGNFVWEEVRAMEDNSESFFVFEDTFPLRRVQNIFFSHQNNVRDTGTYGSFKTLEIQAFGEGYIPGVTMTSGVLDLGKSKNMTSVSWSADILPGTKLEIQTRTGDQLADKLHYFDKKGNEVTKERWEDLPNFRKDPEPQVEKVPGEDWSPWSKPYLHPGARFVSPSPRQYLQMRARLLSEAPDRAVALESLSLSFSEPLARSVVAEVWPDTVHAAKSREFTYLINPSFQVDARGRVSDLGFDQVLIKMPSQAELLGVNIGLKSVELTSMSVRSTSDSLLLQFPFVITSADVVEIRFRTKVFLNGTEFEGSIGNTSDPVLWQNIDPGDASPDAGGNDLVVFVPPEDRLIGNLDINPRIITPNGDGVNDQMGIDFSVFRVDRAQPITVTLYDLSGRMIREILALRGISADYRAVWDGKDGDGGVAPPGFYICRVEVETDQEDAVLVQTVAVAF